MGNQSVKMKKKHSMRNDKLIQAGKQPLYELQQPCFCSISPSKKKHKKLQQAWKVNFFLNCQDLGVEEYPWVEHIQKLVKNELESFRSNYLSEVQQLQYRLEGLLKSGEVRGSLDDENLFDALEGSILVPEQVLKKSVLAANGKQNSMKKTLTRSYLGAVNTTTSNSSIRHNNKNNIISFLDQSMQSLFKNKQTQVDKKIKEDVKLFIKLTQMIQTHIKDQKNALSSIKQQFVTYFSYIYSKSTHQVIINQLLAFIDLYKITMIDYYQLEKFCSTFNNEQILDDGNLNNFVTSIVFKDQRIYETVFSVFRKKNKIRQQHFDQSLDEINKILPSDFSISDEYCLNQKTIDWYMMRMSFEPCIQNVQIQFQEFCPYDNCIKKLKQLDSSKTPMAKLKVMLSCADKVSACMKQFYQSNSLEVKRSIVDADQILSIFQYILVNSKISNLYTHLDIIQNFSNQAEMKSMAGYYYSVILSALQHISNEFKIKQKDQQIIKGTIINSQKPQQEKQ